MSLVTIKPKSELSFDAEFWNSKAVKGYTNCFTYAFDSIECGCNWFSKIPGFEDHTRSPWDPSLLIEKLSNHEAFERLHPDDMPLTQAHLIAVATEGAHVYRYNNINRTWAEKMPSIEARMWDDAGNPLISLESAFWRYSRPSVAYFKLNEVGFSIVQNIHEKDYARDEDQFFNGQENVHPLWLLENYLNT